MAALWRAHGWDCLTGRPLLEVGCGSGGNLLDLLVQWRLGWCVGLWCIVS